MKELLMLSAAVIVPAALASAAFADVTSANVVGYVTQNVIRGEAVSILTTDALDGEWNPFTQDTADNDGRVSYHIEGGR